MNLLCSSSAHGGKTTADSICSVVPMPVSWLFWFPVLLSLKRRCRSGWPLVAAGGGSRYRQQGQAEQVGSPTGAEKDRGDSSVSDSDNSVQEHLVFTETLLTLQASCFSNLGATNDQGPMF